MTTNPALLLNLHDRVFRRIGRLLYPGSVAMAVVGLLAASPSTPLAQSQSVINLGSLNGFVVLGGSLVSNIPTSAITGDIGVSPATGSNITGFGALEVTGTIYAVDASGPAGSVPAAAMLTTAKDDLTIAYNEAAGRLPVPSGAFLNPGSGNMGGLTLVPGLYKFTGAAGITGSNLTLAGNSTDVWIFQITSSLNVGDGIQVILSGGARAANIFWQVGTSAILGTTSAMKGSILADQSISLNTGASLEGRALARIAAVTLASNVITLPSGTVAVHGMTDANRYKLPTIFRTSPSGYLEFIAPTTGFARLRLYGLNGREIATLFHGKMEAGTVYHVHGVDAAAVNLVKGLYLTRLESADGVRTDKVLLSR